MSTLNEYLTQKRTAWLAKKDAARSDPASFKATQLKAQVRALGRSGVREIRIRDFQVISDSPPDFAGYNLGPASPELQLGVLGNSAGASAFSRYGVGLSSTITAVSASGVSTRATLASVMRPRGPRRFCVSTEKRTSLDVNG